MKIYRLSKESYQTLKRVALEEMENKLVLHDNSLSAETDDLESLLLILNEEIAGRGMDRQETVNEFGLELYALYDELLEQK